MGHSNSLGSVQSVGGISNNSSVSSEGLALGGGPVLALVGLAHGLVADLAMAVSVDWLVGSVVDGSNGGRDRGVEDGSVSHAVVAEVGAGSDQES